ncbi:hypothetical protein PsYK624_129460 [Phanerochaete sordida]|uniref:Uncharacterized protein n=1 Tax=Phanerochaete sordida TaxID=48140 RepID=A0A9P3GK87_9APHY|nr:hypothetical protein PsYK624_129460 [Phanerochaete sordida]
MLVNMLHPDLNVVVDRAFCNASRAHPLSVNGTPAQRADTCSAWPLDCLVGLSRSGEDGKAIVDAIIRDRWVARLRQLTSRVDEFRNAMRETGTILSGSVALALLDVAAGFQPGDWDFYAPDEGFDGFCRFLKNDLHAIAKYTGFVDVYIDDLQEQTDLAAQARNGITERRRFVLNGVRLDVLRSRSSSPSYPLAFFHSTVVMNFFHADGFAVAYPWSLFHRSNTASTRITHTSARVAVEKYRGRGYTTFDTFHALWAADGRELTGCLPYGTCARAPRHFGDRAP